MIGIIGGTGLYAIDGIQDIFEKEVDTPFGAPSAKVSVGKFADTQIAFLPRHGKNHQSLPSEINFRANIWALKSVGVRRIISVSAVGSLREEIRPGDIAVPNQYFDWTKGRRIGTFFGNGMVGHISSAKPTCPSLESWIKADADAMGISLHLGKTYACVEGPRLGTRAESLFLRQAGCDLVGMTNVPEAFLAREAQLCYATIAVVTDYDCWLEDPEQHASVDKVIEFYRKNIFRVQSLIRHLLDSKVRDSECSCRSALKYSLLTSEEHLSGERKSILKFLRE